MSNYDPSHIAPEINSELIQRLDAIIEAVAKTSQLRARQLVALRSNIKRLERKEKKYDELSKYQCTCLAVFEHEEDCESRK